MTVQSHMRHVGRRTFLAGAAAAAVTVVKPSAVRGTEANSKVTLGLIGCGGRGGWIANLFQADGNYRFLNCADYFQERVDTVGNRVGIEAGHRYTGLSGYKKLLEEEVDAVVIETPPYFHPEQADAAVDAGKHVFLAKPIAVDAPGCLSVGESGKRATEQGRVFLIDFQTRANPLYQEAVRRVRAGDLGKLVSGEAHYPWQNSAHDVPIQNPADRLRYWYQTLALSGDVIVEQDIHVLDVATWFLGGHPVKAFGTGGRAIRRHGNIWDHFSVTYWFPNDVSLIFHSQKGIPGVKDEIRCRIFGSEGVAYSDYFGEVWIRGKKPYEGGSTGSLYKDGAVTNIAEFHRAITEGDHSNPTVVPSVHSNLTSVLGRTAAYRGETVTWDEMIKKGEKLEPDLRGLEG
jgi:predicted dehydrogenase